MRIRQALTKTSRLNVLGFPEKHKGIIAECAFVEHRRKSAGKEVSNLNNRTSDRPDLVVRLTFVLTASLAL